MQNRLPFIIGFAACAVAIGIALYFQHVLGLEPCPLCIFQRLSVMALGVVFLLGALHGPVATGKKVYAWLATITSVVGIGIAMRHLWLQYGTHEELACGPGLDYMLEIMPLQEVLVDVFKGTGECAEIVWSLFGISIPGWTLMAFLVALVFSLRLALVKQTSSW